jgi:hypothetical protein
MLKEHSMHTIVTKIAMKITAEMLQGKKQRIYPVLLNLLHLNQLHGKENDGLGHRL